MTILTLTKVDVGMMEDVGTSANKLIQLDSNGKIPAVDGSLLTNMSTALSGSSDPTLSTNPSTGVGTKFKNTTDGEMFICTDATAGENVWTNVGAGSGDVKPAAFQGETFGYHMGGYYVSGSWTLTNTIQKYSFTTDANATDVSDLTVGRRFAGGGKSATHGYAAGGHTEGAVSGNEIDKFSFSAGSNATDVGDLTTPTWCVGQASMTYNYVTRGGLASDQRKIEKYAVASDGNASDIANMTFDHTSMHAGCSSATYGYTGGSQDNNTAGLGKGIDKFAFASDADATDAGDLTNGRYSSGGNSSETYGYCTGGYQSGYKNIIDKWPFASDANATDVGDLLGAIGELGGNNSSSSLTYGYTAGGYPDTNTIQKHSFTTDGNSTDVANLYNNVINGNACGTQI